MNTRPEFHADNQDELAPGNDRIGIFTETGLNGLEAVLAIARHGSVRAAALDLGMPITVLRHFPQMEVDLVTKGRLVDIVVESFDLGLRPADLVPRDMIALPFGRLQRYAVFASPDWIATDGTPQSPADQPLRVGPAPRRGAASPELSFEPAAAFHTGNVSYAGPSRRSLRMHKA